MSQPMLKVTTRNAKAIRSARDGQYEQITGICFGHFICVHILSNYSREKSSSGQTPVVARH